MKRLTNSQKALMRAEYLADPDATYRTLAAKHGVSESQAQRALAGVMRPRGGKERSRLSTEKMLRMHQSGLTLKEIGRQAGISESGVSIRLTRHHRNRETVS